MPIIEIPINEVGKDDIWWNYHRTDCAHLRKRWALRSAGAPTGREDLAEGALAVQLWLRKALADQVPVRPVGGAWSPSNIQIVQQGWMLNTRRFNRCFRIAAEHLAPGATIDPAALLLVEAGTQIDEINDRLECDMQRSLRSTGASNGQTLAGACATGTHGSVIEAGGIQDHVRAVQVVTPDGIHWIEPTAGLMRDAFIAATGSTPLRDDAAFAAAQVAMGSLGVVTAMVIETVPRYLVRPIFQVVDFSEEDLDKLARGEFRAFAAKHGVDEEPYFVMVITNPVAPFRRKAVVRLLFHEDWHEGYPAATHAQLGAAYDAFSMLGWLLRNFPWARGWILQTIMKLGVGKGTSASDPKVYGTWGETTETHRPLAELFTGSVFCERSRLPEVFDVMRKGFSGAGGSTVMTLRFLKGGPGLLSPARWEHVAGIDCDGPGGSGTERAFVTMLDALEAKGIPFTRHWGKFNRLDAARVAHDFGDDLVRWKAVRDQLLPQPAHRRLFACATLDRLGLTI